MQNKNWRANEGNPKGPPATKSTHDFCL